MITQASIIFPLIGNDGTPLRSIVKTAIAMAAAIGGGATADAGGTGFWNDSGTPKTEPIVRVWIAALWDESNVEKLRAVAAWFAEMADQRSVLVDLPGIGVQFVTRDGGLRDDFAGKPFDVTESDMTGATQADIAAADEAGAVAEFLDAADLRNALDCEAAIAEGRASRWPRDGLDVVATLQATGDDDDLQSLDKVIAESEVHVIDGPFTVTGENGETTGAYLINEPPVTGHQHDEPRDPRVAPLLNLPGDGEDYRRYT